MEIEQCVKRIQKANLQINQKLVETGNHYYNDYEIYNGPFKYINSAIELITIQSFLLFKEVFEFNIM